MKLRLTIALLLYGALAFAGEARWSVPDTVRVTGEKVFLADLLVSADGSAAPTQLEGVFITAAPDPGATRVIAGRYVHSRLQAVGMGDVPVPAQIRIERAGTVIDPALGEAAVREYIRQHAPWPADQYEIKIVRSHAPLNVAEGAVTAQVLEPGPRTITGQRSYRVEYRQGSRKIASGVFTAEVHVQAAVFRAAHTIRHGAVISEYDLVQSRDDLANVAGDPITDRSQIVGARASRVIREGEVLVSGTVSPAPVVEAGGAVMIMAPRGCVVVRAFGIAQQGGAVGEVIKVKNVQSNKVVLARVTDASTVQALF